MSEAMILQAIARSLRKADECQAEMGMLHGDIALLLRKLADKRGVAFIRLESARQELRP